MNYASIRIKRMRFHHKINLQSSREKTLSLDEISIRISFVLSILSEEGNSLVHIILALMRCFWKERVFDTLTTKLCLSKILSISV